jgi:hypothetical protein
MRTASSESLTGCILVALLGLATALLYYGA